MKFLENHLNIIHKVDNSMYNVWAFDVLIEKDLWVAF